MKEKRCVDEVEPNCMQPPIYEPCCEKICHREINHEIRHIKPVHTRIINHHIYHHTYTPCFTCSEEDEICNVYDNNCNY